MFSKNLKLTGRDEKVQVLNDLFDVKTGTNTNLDVLYYDGAVDNRWEGATIGVAGLISAGNNINISGGTTINVDDPFLVDIINEKTLASGVSISHTLKATSGIVESGIPLITQGNLILNNDTVSEPNILLRGTGGDANIRGSVNGGVELRPFIQFIDQPTPGIAPAAIGFLYKKTGNDGLFWKADGGTEVDLSLAGTGVDMVAAIDTSPNANGLFISGDNISTQTASATAIGMVSISSQTLAGNKTFANEITVKDVYGRVDRVEFWPRPIGDPTPPDRVMAIYNNATVSCINMAEVSLGSGPASQVYLIDGSTRDALNSNKVESLNYFNLALSQTASDTQPPDLFFFKSRGTIGLETIVLSGDDLATIDVHGFVGGVQGYIKSAQIRVDSTGTVTSTKVPSKFEFLNMDNSGVLNTNLIINEDRSVNAVSQLQEGGSRVIITAANVGSGAGLIFRDKTTNQLNLKSILEGSGIQITNNADDISIVNTDRNFKKEVYSFSPIRYPSTTTNSWTATSTFDFTTAYTKGDWRKLTGTSILSTQGSDGSFTFASDTITINTSGTYEFSVSISFAGTVGSRLHFAGLGVNLTDADQINTAVIPGAGATEAATSSEYTSISAFGIRTLAAADTCKLFLAQSAAVGSADITLGGLIITFKRLA